MNQYKSLLAGAALAFVTGPVMALGSFDKNFFNESMQDEFDAFSEDLGAVLSYKAIAPAEPLGLLGFDIGLEGSFTNLANVDKWGSALETDEDLLPLIKLHAHKGLPFGIDVGAVYSQIPTTDIQYMGAELRYSFVSGNVAIPAVAVRGTYTQLLGIDELDFSTMGLELTVSKGFLMATPYAGIGQIWVDSEFNYNPTDNPATDVSLSSDPSMFKWFVGLNFNLGLMNLAAEIDTTGDATTYSGKLGFRF